MLVLDEGMVSPQKENLFHRVMSGSDAPVYVLSRNKFAQQVAQAVTVRAFIDDFTDEKVFLDRPVIRMTDLPSECIVVSCVVAGNALIVLDRLKSAGAQHVIDYFTLARLAPDVFGPVDYCTGNRQDILENAPRYQWVYNLLADDISRQTFAKVVQFRLSMDLNHMQGFSMAMYRQYIENFLPQSAGDVFVDGGGYDGQTTLQFAAWSKAYRRIHYFEPLPDMMEISRSNLAALRDVRFVQKGLFSRNDRLRFDAAGPGSSLSPTGQTEIDVVRLDDEVQEPITFLKLDIEGAEYEALLGAAAHIRSDTPTMAVCIYHNQQDFWRIPFQVLQYNDRYNLYVRHYSEGVNETVMFFVPK
jgi:FkbM family methyltransferase